MPIFGESPDDIGPDHVQKVEFDIPVTVSTQDEDKVGAGITIVPFFLGGTKTTGSEDMRVSRMRFSIPIVTPTTVVLKSGAVRDPSGQTD